MEWPEALEVVMARTRNPHYRVVTADDHPHHESWRRRMVEKATGAPPEYPPPIARAGNALSALGRVVGAVIRGEPVHVEAAVHDARLAACMGCEFNGEAPAGVKCTKCGCGGSKLRLATERCPVGKWEAVPDGR